MKRRRDVQDAESRGHELQPMDHHAETVLSQVLRRAPLPAPTVEILIQVLEVAAVELAIMRRGLENMSVQMKLGRFPEP